MIRIGIGCLDRIGNALELVDKESVDHCDERRQIRVAIGIIAAICHLQGAIIFGAVFHDQIDKGWRSG